MKQKILISVLVVIMFAVGTYLFWSDIQISRPTKQANIPVMTVHTPSTPTPMPVDNSISSYAFLFESEKDPYQGNIVGYFGGGAFGIYVPDWIVQNWEMHLPNIGEASTITPKLRRKDDDFSDIAMYLSTSTEQFNADYLYETDLKDIPTDELAENEVLLSRPGEGGTTIDMENNTRIYHIRKVSYGRTSDVYYMDGKGLTLKITFDAKSELYGQFSDHIRDFVEGIGELKPQQG